MKSSAGGPVSELLSPQLSWMELCANSAADCLTACRLPIAAFPLGQMLLTFGSMTTSLCGRTQRRSVVSVLKQSMQSQQMMTFPKTS